MAPLFLLASTPVQTPDGGFAIILGTIAGVKVERFASRSEARDHLSMVEASLHTAVEYSFKYRLIDSETDYLPLREKFDVEYMRMSTAQSSISSIVSAARSRLGSTMARILDKSK